MKKIERPGEDVRKVEVSTVITRWCVGFGGLGVRIGVGFQGWELGMECPTPSGVAHFGYFGCLIDV